SGGSWSWPQRCQSIHDTDLPSAGRQNATTASSVLRVSTARSSRSSGQNTFTVTSSPDTVTCDSSSSWVPSFRWKAIPKRTCNWSATHCAIPEPGVNRSRARNRIGICYPSQGVVSEVAGVTELSAQGTNREGSGVAVTDSLGCVQYCEEQ